MVSCATCSLIHGCTSQIVFHLFFAFLYSNDAYCWLINVITHGLPISPLTRNEDFVTRDDVLKIIHENISEKDDRPRRMYSLLSSKTESFQESILRNRLVQGCDFFFTHGNMFGVNS